MTPSQHEAVLKMHNLLLEALRHREQDILRYLIFLGSALGGFAWLLSPSVGGDSVLFVVGTIIAQGTLLLGALYSLALGYNFRYITLQLAKFESEEILALKDYVLCSWPRDPKDFRKRFCGADAIGAPMDCGGSPRALVLLGYLGGIEDSRRCLAGMA